MNDCCLKSHNWMTNESVFKGELLPTPPYRPSCTRLQATIKQIISENIFIGIVQVTPSLTGTGARSTFLFACIFLTRTRVFSRLLTSVAPKLRRVGQKFSFPFNTRRRDHSDRKTGAFLADYMPFSAGLCTLSVLWARVKVPVQVGHSIVSSFAALSPTQFQSCII